MTARLQADIVEPPPSAALLREACRPRSTGVGMAPGRSHSQHPLCPPCPLWLKIQNPIPARRDKIQNRSAAFTLFEVLIVIAIMGVLAAFAWPSFYGERDAASLTETATRMKGLIAMCRAEAMNESRRFRVQFFQDGSLELTAQRDAIEAPHEWVQVSTDWSRMQFIVDGVWVESVLALPGGPPPVLIDDETIEFADEDEFVQLRVEELEVPENLFFETDGTSDSARWVLRDTLGRGLELTLDGRLGRVDIKSVDRLEADQVKRPMPIEREPAEEPQRREGERR